MFFFFCRSFTRFLRRFSASVFLFFLLALQSPKNTTVTMRFIWGTGATENHKRRAPIRTRVWAFYLYICILISNRHCRPARARDGSCPWPLSLPCNTLQSISARFSIFDPTSPPGSTLCLLRVHFIRALTSVQLRNTVIVMHVMKHGNVKITSLKLRN